MLTPSIKINLSRAYLLLVPFLVTLTGFEVGYISYKIYLPIWIINLCLMSTAAWILGRYAFWDKNGERKYAATGAFCVIIPWMLFSMFFGLGPPPQTTEGWVKTATEQEVRYLMLVAAGLFLLFGFSIWREVLGKMKVGFYSLISYTAILVAIPLFVINMTWWGAGLPEFYKYLQASGSENTPDWFQSISKVFEMIGNVEIVLFYLATAAFATSLNHAGWLGKTAYGSYIFFSLLAILITILPIHNQLMETLSYFVAIPAIPFLMPYFMGIHLLKRVGSKSNDDH